ncbi:hypothetical protein [Arenimonas sp.]|jgi:phage terminase large subunit-like protein|uniref:phage terminase large subunit family protein n=1 Tax=Arenimonas sp. TaxID=1872635 RepID=UPI0037BFBE83
MVIAVDRGDFTRVVVGVDPAVTSGDAADETGIVVVALGPHVPETCRTERCSGHAYVLEDATIPRELRPTPDQWASRAVEAFDQWQADRVIAEGNQGGDLVTQVLRTVRPGLPVTRVTARVGKRTRAEPIAALYEQGRVHHVGSAVGFAVLEDQLTTWTQSSGESPDRLDALVWAISSLGIAGTDGIIPDFVPVGLGKSNAFDLGGLGRL